MEIPHLHSLGSLACSGRAAGVVARQCINVQQVRAQGQLRTDGPSGQHGAGRALLLPVIRL